MSDRICDMPDDEKPREKLAKFGASSLDHAELLAIFLRTGIKGRSAIQIGRDLIKHFGSLSALGSAGVDALAACPGLGLAKACQLVAAFELGSRAAREQVSREVLDSPEKIYEIFSREMAWLPYEKLLVVMLDTRLRHLATVEVSSGTQNQTISHPRDILRPVIMRNAYGFILIHNHPSGDPTPSNADNLCTENLLSLSKMLQVPMMDHIIIGKPSEGREAFFSYRQKGRIS
jgi:DNA repair protein RadC